MSHANRKTYYPSGRTLDVLNWIRTNGSQEIVRQGRGFMLCGGGRWRKFPQLNRALNVLSRNGWIDGTILKVSLTPFAIKWFREVERARASEQASA